MRGLSEAGILGWILRTLKTKSLWNVRCKENSKLLRNWLNAIKNRFIILLIVGILLGLFAESQLIGQRVMEYRAIKEPSPVATIVVGFIVIAFGALIPIIGQLALLLIILKGFGAVIGALFRSRSQRSKDA